MAREVEYLVERERIAVLQKAGERGFRVLFVERLRGAAKRAQVLEHPFGVCAPSTVSSSDVVVVKRGGNGRSGLLPGAP